MLTPTMSLAIWPFQWMLGLKGAIPWTLISKENFPLVFAWVDRFNEAIATAKAIAPKPTKLKGADALKHITQSEFAEPEGEVDNTDPLGLQKGQDVESWPIDSGSRHHDRGRLISLTSEEVVLASQTKIGEREVRIHHPRWNFRTRAASGEGAKL